MAFVSAAAAQRERDRVALWVDGVAVDGLTTTALVEGLPSLIAGDQPAVLEPPRVLRRLNSLRGLSHEQVEQVLTRGP